MLTVTYQDEFGTKETYEAEVVRVVHEAAVDEALETGPAGIHVEGIQRRSVSKTIYPFHTGEVKGATSAPTVFVMNSSGATVACHRLN